MRPQFDRAAGFVVLVGPDGTGKTTLANALMDLHSGRSLYIHFRPPVLSRPQQSPTDEAMPKEKRSETGPAPLGWLRIATSWLRFWLGYLRWIRPALKSGALVVADRWAFGYIAQPVALGFKGPHWLARFICAHVPQPDLLVRLSGPPHLIAQRKPDLSAGEIDSEESLWDTIPEIDVILDATEDPIVNAQEVLTKLHGTRP